MRISLLAALSTLALAACTGLTDSPDAVAEQTTEGLSVQGTGAEDTYVSTSYPTTVRGSRTELRVGATASATQQTYLKFLVSGIPAGALNVKATLELHANATSSDVVEVHQAKSSSWSEATLTWPTAPGATLAIVAQASGTTAGTVTSFDVSSAVQANGTVSFVLEVAQGATVSFASREAGAATAPNLKITYDVSAPATTAFGAGYSPHTDARYGELATQFGALKVVRSYDGSSGVSPFLNTYQAQDVAHGATSAYSFKYAPAEVIAGKHDTELKQFFAGIKDGHTVYWTYWHEPDDELYKTHSFTPTDYRAAWAHIKSIADAAKAARPMLKALATLIIMEYSMRPNVTASRPLLGPNGMYPGDGVIDVFGVDAYNADATSGGTLDPATQFGKVIDFAQQHGKPWAIGEFGSCPVAGDANGRATYMTNAIKYWKSRQSVPAYVAYFDLDWPVCDYRLDTDAKATAVWHNAVSVGLSAF